MKYNITPATGFIAIAFLGLVSCTKNSAVNNLSNPDTRIYITQRDSTVNFSSYKTFSIDDSVTVLDNGQSSRSLTPTGQAFIDAITKYMQQGGYTLVTKAANPDLGINVTYINTTTTGIIDYSSYYDYYGGYYDPTYWGYGGYGYYSPYMYGTYQINSGALSIDMLDLKNAAANGKIKIVWNGLIRGEGIADATTADSQVQALFSQSPYLKTN
ncbi:DUF4136 domain-containing protein [Hydrotalea sp.]|uniref:DUF4136 domain-containing protein n=1 Tax=Hydrotalea sp. TaxID=2881279 RepID=UPI00261E4AB6|nr:DUF4136 domain-containing protein [Hydrotalea sp.]